MTTLITGATGYIGGRLAQELVRRGESVRALVRKGSDTVNLSELGVELRYGDVTDQETVSLAMQGCNRLYHVASVFEWWLPDRKRYYHVNVEGSKNVLSKALEMQLSRVVYTSTTETIGESRGEKKTEVTPHRGFHLSDYAKSKYLAEQEAMRLCGLGLPLVCVNPSAVYGPGNLKESGEIMINFLKGKLKAYFGGYMNFVYIDDVVSAHILAMEKGKLGERYILAGDQDILMKDWWSLIAELSKIQKIPRELPSWQVKLLAFVLETLANFTKKPPMISKDGARLALYGMRADNTKAKTELGMTFTPIKEGLIKTLEWYRNYCSLR